MTYVTCNNQSNPNLNPMMRISFILLEKHKKISVLSIMGLYIKLN